MKRTAALGMLLAAGCAGTMPRAGEPAPTETPWDPQAETELSAWMQSVNDAWAARDLERIRSFIADDGFLTSYDLDADGKPISFGSKTEIVGFAEKVFAQMKQVGGAMTFRTRKIECRATSTFGVCVDEFDATMTMGGTSRTMAFRGTGVMHKGATGWVGTHWHASLAKLPEAPPVVAAVPAPAWAPVGLNAKDLAWETHVDDPGSETAIVSGEPGKGRFIGFNKFPAMRWPQLSYGETHAVYLVKGTIKITFADGRIWDLTPGAAAVIPAKTIHMAESKTGGLVFVCADSPLGVIGVGEKASSSSAVTPSAAPPAPIR